MEKRMGIKTTFNAITRTKITIVAMRIFLSHKASSRVRALSMISILSNQIEVTKQPMIIGQKKKKEEEEIARERRGRAYHENIIKVTKMAKATK